MGRNRYKIVDNRLPHFMTCTVLHWIPVFTRPETVNILLDSLSFLSQEGLKVYAYVVLENHLHIIAQSDQLEKDMLRFKAHTARKILMLLRERNIHTILDQLAFYKKAHKTDRKLQFWQEGFHPEWISDDKMLKQKIEYIHQNPVKRGYIDKPEHWRYSSARDYSGQDGLIEIYKQW